MVLKHKIIDIEYAQQNKNNPYIIIMYNTTSNLLTFGGRARHSEHILEIVKGLFYIEDEYISEPKITQRINIRFEVQDMDFALYTDVMTMLKGNTHFQRHTITNLNRMM